ncbi:YHS domain-containing (seleno)protein [Pelagibacterium montanilacus]|uniref:YHS domain-containing (seleno)protein n=1 Tax=Pelagibacterium montanilacus TaxID=2185280 RepID=UPI0013DF6A41|nr:YHS domain-containing (seleno)protein [Pelagibacterium montanilacus]
MLGLGLLFAAQAGAQGRAVSIDPLTGVAISGYDPVSYFVEEAPSPGRADFTARWSGVTWYFASAANRDVFEADPETYAPLFGGHCAMSMARGYRSEGNPRIYRIVGNRLVLFHSAGNRSAFDLSVRHTIEQAMGVWEDLPDRIAPQFEVPFTPVGQ